MITLKLALIGHPVAHSRSPQVYDRLFARHGIDGSFELIDIPMLESEAVERLKNYDAFAITMPHKAAIIPYLSKITVQAELMQSVNFVIVDRFGDLHGHSTDGEGFVRGIEDAGYGLHDKTAFIYGAGGAAGAVAAAMQSAGAAVRIHARRQKQADALADRLGAETVGLLDPTGCDIFVNATPLGMKGDYDSCDFLRRLNPGALVCDLVYAPPQTKLLKTARDMGFDTLNGLPMLENQAQVALDLLLSFKQSSCSALFEQ